MPVAPKPVPVVLTGPIPGPTIAFVSACEQAPVACDPLWNCGPVREVGDLYVTAGGSLLPNGGLYAGVGQVFKVDCNAVWSFEILGTFQFIDEKTFITDGNPEAGNWYQLQAGVAVRTNPSGRRHAVLRAGAMWFQAEGEPNLIDVGGDWLGVYLGAGFETDFGDGLSIGPSVTVLAGAPVDGGQDYSLVPQFSWGLTWWTGPTCPSDRTDCACRPLGEFYADVFASAVPGIGGGTTIGQVFARSNRIAWSFEAAATYQSVDEASFFGDGSGEFARVSTGVKALFAPESRTHLALRAGSTWFRTTGTNAFVDTAADYFGGYVSAGFEWDIGSRVSTGPELGVIVVNREGEGSELEAVPLVAWHLTFKF